MVDNIRLQAVSIESDKEKMLYGSQEDEVAALKSLSAIELDDQQLKETFISHFMSKSAKLSEVIYRFCLLQSLKNMSFRWEICLFFLSKYEKYVHQAYDSYPILSI